LIQELAQATDREHKSVRVMPGMGFAELFARLAPELGCRDPDPQPLGLGGSVDFRILGMWAKNLPGPRLLHLEAGHHLLENQSRSDPNISRFLEAIATQ